MEAKIHHSPSGSLNGVISTATHNVVAFYYYVISNASLPCTPHGKQQISTSQAKLMLIGLAILFMLLLSGLPAHLLQEQLKNHTTAFELNDQFPLKCPPCHRTNTSCIWRNLYQYNFGNNLYPTLQEAVKLALDLNYPLERYAINLGAKDGKSMADETYPLYSTLDFAGLALEASESYKKELLKNMPPKVNSEFGYVTPENVQAIFERNGVPKNLGVLKIDIDSYDCAVARQIMTLGYRPKFLWMEVNPMVPPPFKFEWIFDDNASYDALDLGTGNTGVGCSLQQQVDDLWQYGYQPLYLRGYHTSNERGVDALYIHNSMQFLSHCTESGAFGIYKQWLDVAGKTYSAIHPRTKNLKIGLPTSYVLAVEKVDKESYKAMDERLKSYYSDLGYQGSVYKLEQRQQ